jgi:hypothetical protein
LLGNGCNRCAAIEEQLELVLSVQSVSLYDEDHLPLEMSLEMAVRRLGGLCHMAISLGVSQLERLVMRQSPFGKNVSVEAKDIVSIHHQAMTDEDTAD